MQRFFKGVLSIVEQLGCEIFQTLCIGCKVPSLSLLCAQCISFSPLPLIPDSETQSALKYEEPWRSVLHEVKFHRQKACLSHFERAIDECDFSWIPPDTTVVPVPLHWLAFHKRGFNQSDWLARNVSKRTGLTYEGEKLWKTRATPPQSSLGGTARKTNLLDSLTWGSKHSPKRVLIVDDVLTTGATIKACREVLKKTGSQEVFAWTLFRATPPSRQILLP